jgi:hypothetical protein
MEAIDLFMCQGMRDRVRVGTSRKEGAVIVLLKEKSGSGASAVASLDFRSYFYAQKRKRLVACFCPMMYYVLPSAHNKL